MTLRTDELDISGALLVMAETKESLERIRMDDSGVNNEVQAACSFFKQFDVDPEYEFQKIHRKRVPPRRLDEALETVADLTMASFYRKASKGQAVPKCCKALSFALYLSTISLQK